MSLVVSHLPPHLLAGFALGDLAPACSLLAACHLTFCPACRTQVAAHEKNAGALLEASPDAHLPGQAFANLLAKVDRLDRRDPLDRVDRVDVRARVSTPLAEVNGLPIPRPLGHWLAEQAARGDRISLRSMGPGLRGLRLEPKSSARPRARLLFFRPSFTLPVHRHAGAEHTLVLAGGFSDGNQHYGRGDIASPHPNDWHAPQIDGDGPCLALVVNDGPIVLSSFAKRVLLAWVDV